MLKGEIISELHEQLMGFIEANYPNYKFISKCGMALLAKPLLGVGQWLILMEDGKEYHLEKHEALNAYINYQRKVIEGVNANIEDELNNMVTFTTSGTNDLNIKFKWKEND